MFLETSQQRPAQGMNFNPLLATGDDDFAAQVKFRWSPEKVKKLLGKKKLLLSPDTHALLLREMGLMNRDASISPDQVKKFLQINHMATLFWPHLLQLRKTMPLAELQLVDFGCGNSYLGLALAALWADAFGRTGLKIHAIDLNEKVLRTSLVRASSLNLASLFEFYLGTLGKVASLASYPEKANGALPPRVHGVLALHACDRATDEALAFGLLRKADWIAVAPCCQAELAQIFTHQLQQQSTLQVSHDFDSSTAVMKKSPLAVLLGSPQLRRESAATLTDGLRMSLTRALGYEVTATEFVPSTHTPKNRLITCERRGNFNNEAWQEYLALKDLLRVKGLALEEYVQELIAASFHSKGVE